jgi:hypothetical protein
MVHAFSAAILCIRDKLQLPFDWKKTSIVGSSQEVVDRVAASMQDKAGGQITASSVRKLGGDCSYGHASKPILKVFRGRVQRALSRYRVIQRLADGQPHSQVFRAGPQQEALYGSHLVMAEPRQVDLLRQQAIRAAMLSVPVSDPHLRHIFLSVELDPLFDMQVRTLEAWARE